LNHLLDNNKKRIRCPRCSQNRTLRDCACEMVWDYPFESIYSFLDYDDTVQGIMRHVKYGGKKKLAHYIGALFSGTVPESVLEGVDIVTAIPLHWLRRRKRGYNQAEWLARGLISGLSAQQQKHNGHRTEIIPLFDILFRKRRTRTQVKLDRSERQSNVKGAFSVAKGKEEILREKTVILVDDVITTGATTASCTEALLAAGCKGVRVVSLARD
jgi:ComF family protein